MDNIFKKFNEDFFKNSKRKIVWFDKTGVISHSEYVIEITFDDLVTINHFIGYNVVVVHKTHGLITKKFFRFSEHLEMVHREDSQKYYHVWRNDGKLDWYISKPKDTSEMVKVIDEWIDIYLY